MGGGMRLHCLFFPKYDGLVKNRHTGENRYPVVCYNTLKFLDSGVHRNDE